MSMVPRSSSSAKLRRVAICEGEREDAIGNDADGQRFARSFERNTHMEGRVIVAGLFGQDREGDRDDR